LIRDEFGDRPISIFFPALSPDLNRVFFKIASPVGGHYRSKEASHRALLICYDLKEKRFLFGDKRWGHPAWSPDSNVVMDVPHNMLDVNTGIRQHLNVMRLPGSHPSFAPDGTLYVSDVALDRIEGSGAAPGEWGVVLVDSTTEEMLLLHRFDESHGTDSWRRCHPHPIHSADGARIYFCASSTPWAQLTVITPIA
jgi:hypothetical protein